VQRCRSIVAQRGRASGQCVPRLRRIRTNIRHLFVTGMALATRIAQGTFPAKPVASAIPLTTFHCETRIFVQSQAPPGNTRTGGSASVQRCRSIVAQRGRASGQCVPRRSLGTRLVDLADEPDQNQLQHQHDTNNRQAEPRHMVIHAGMK
jgi:hypothetical protein